jgi:hypothetical protein
MNESKKNLKRVKYKKPNGKTSCVLPKTEFSSKKTPRTSLGIDTSSSIKTVSRNLNSDLYQQTPVTSILKIDLTNKPKLTRQTRYNPPLPKKHKRSKTHTLDENNHLETIQSISVDKQNQQE